LPASLYLIATPIGNLEDMTYRGVRILRDEVSLIACEDTRQTQKLLAHYEVLKPLISYHEHNEAARAGEMIAALERGESVALVSDAGTPLISDPGYRLVAAAVGAGFRVVPVPGPSAMLAALAASGLPTNDFRFIGFVPSKSAARRKALEAISGEPSTVIAYESPHRILETLRDIAEILGERRMVLARELTKIHEEFLRGTAAEILATLEQRNAIKGEITLVIAPSEQPNPAGDPIHEIERLEQQGLGRMEAIKAVAKQFRLPKRQVYKLSMERGNNPPDKRRE
jgi:16S rRNA (cytidine1402-2'-O)-methyltransferase